MGTGLRGTPTSGDGCHRGGYWSVELTCFIRIDHAGVRNHIRDSRIARLSIRLANRERGFFSANSYSGFVRINRGPVGRFSLRTSRSLLSFSSPQNVFALPDRPDFGYHFFAKKMIWATLPLDLTPFPNLQVRHPRRGPDSRIDSSLR